MSDVKGRLKRLEREAAVAHSHMRPNVFEWLMQLMAGRVTLDDVDPDHRDIVERLFHAQNGGDSASASRQGSQEGNEKTQKSAQGEQTVDSPSRLGTP